MAGPGWWGRAAARVPGPGSGYGGRLLCLTTYPAVVRSVTMAKALRSVMPRLAAMSRTRAPGSWAMHSRTRPCLLRKHQLDAQRIPQILEINC